MIECLTCASHIARIECNATAKIFLQIVGIVESNQVRTKRKILNPRSETASEYEMCICIGIMKNLQHRYTPLHRITLCENSRPRIYTRKTCPQTHYTVVNLFTRIQELKQHRKNRTDNKKIAHISHYTYKPRNTSLLKTKLKSHVALPSKLQIKLQLSDCEA